MAPSAKLTEAVQQASGSREPMTAVTTASLAAIAEAVR